MKMTARRFSPVSPCLACLLVLGLSAAACEKKADPTPAVVPAPSASTTTQSADAAPPRPAGVKLEKLTRGDFNRTAVELALPIFWVADTNNKPAIHPQQ